MTRTYPTYNYTIPDKFDLDFSDSGNLVYITARDKNIADEKRDAVILVYRTQYPAAAAFYDVFHLNMPYQDLIIDATGSFGDYVTVADESNLTMFRQYEDPVLVFGDVFGDFKFQLTYTNHPENSTYLVLNSSVHTANYPEDIIINASELNQSDYLTGTVEGKDTTYSFPIDDNGWFNGSVLNYTL